MEGGNGGNGGDSYTGAEPVLPGCCTGTMFWTPLRSASHSTPSGLSATVCFCATAGAHPAGPPVPAQSSPASTLALWPSAHLTPSRACVPVFPSVCLSVSAWYVSLCVCVCLCVGLLTFSSRSSIVPTYPYNLAFCLPPPLLSPLLLSTSSCRVAVAASCCSLVLVLVVPVVRQDTLDTSSFISSPPVQLNSTFLL